MRVVLPGIPPEVAVIVVVPAATVVTKPLLLTVATEGSDELQAACEVKSWIVPSENVPVAANCCVACRGMLELAGVIEMEDKVAEVTVRDVLPEVFPKVAAMVTVPGVTPVARPALNPLLTVAIEVLDELQVTCEVISWVVPSENVPVAANCCVACTDMVGLAGVTVMDCGPVLPQANKHAAKDIRDNIAKTNLRVFMSPPFSRQTKARSSTLSPDWFIGPMIPQERPRVN